LLQAPPLFPERETVPPGHREVDPFAVTVDATGAVARVTVLFKSEMAPAIERPLPKSLAPAAKLIAPFTNAVPRKTELVPRDSWPFICQYTLHMEAPLIRITLDEAAADKAPFILIMNTELGSPNPSKVKLPDNVAAAPMQ
jgi:hypothetical protein